jgi:hypothetical protein
MVTLSSIDTAVFVCAVQHTHFISMHVFLNTLLELYTLVLVLAALF